MITREVPYRECSKFSTSQLKNHILAGHLPKCLGRLNHKLAKEFILTCLQVVELRPSAYDLLQHEFLQSLGELDDEAVVVSNYVIEEIPMNVDEKTVSNDMSSEMSVDSCHYGYQNEITDHKLVKSNSLTDMELNDFDRVEHESDLVSYVEFSASTEDDKQDLTDGLRAELITGLATLGQGENVHNVIQQYFIFYYLTYIYLLIF